MTATHNDRYQTPPFITASCLILRLASVLFQKVSDGEEDRADAVRNWNAMRRLAQTMLDINSTHLSEDEIDRLGKLALYVHQTRHPEGLAQADHEELAKHCPCDVAATIRDLAEVMQKDRVAA